jgi:hypothetical protein
MMPAATSRSSAARWSRSSGRARASLPLASRSLRAVSVPAVNPVKVIPRAHVRPASDPSLAEIRQAMTVLVAELSRHLNALAVLPAGPTSFALLADLHEPVRRAVARWDHAVLAHTETLPVAIDDGCEEDFTD